MPEGTEQHLEHAEHAQHAAHDPFNRRVALTMAITAAVLAAVAMLSHRTHNATLLYQNEATMYHTRASDQWNYYQTKKQRGYTKEDFAEEGRFIHYATKDDRPLKLDNVQDQEDGAGPSTSGTNGAKSKDAQADKKKKKGKGPVDPAQLPAYWKNQAATYVKEAEGIQKKAEGLEKQAEEKKAESEHMHHRAERLDLGHLGLEMGLVLCSIALLARFKGFWLAGIAVGVVGAFVSFSSFFLGGH
jgi:hypothetical protein